MKTYRIFEVCTKVYAFDVKAENEEEALRKVEGNSGDATDDIERAPQADDTISREYDCDGEV